MASALDVYNQALAACSAPGRLSSLTEQSREREECERWYETVVDTVQESAYWPGCRTIAILPLLRQRDYNQWIEHDPLPGFGFKYSIPSNYLRAWHLTDYSTFELGSDPIDNTRVLYSTAPQARLVYARRQLDVNHWTPSQRMATIYGLAAHIAGPLTGKQSIISKNFQMANRLLLEAQSLAASSEQSVDDHIPAAIQARGYHAVSTRSRYVYPAAAGFFHDI